MTICKYYLQGNCKFGDRCKFEHPPGQGGTQGGQDQNRFGLFGRVNNEPNNSRNQPGRGPPPRDNRNNRNQSDRRPYGVTQDILEEDLRLERPQWIMSSYGPGRDAPSQLFGGFPLEQSPEEIRVLHYQAVAGGNPQQSAEAEQQLAAQSNQQVQNVLNDLNGALDYLASGANQHPNRNDICNQGTTAPRNARDGPFSKSTRHREMRNNNSPFQTRGFGMAPTNPSPQTGFGAPPPTDAQPQAFGMQNPNTGFGSVQPPQQPAGFGQPPQPTGFGQPPQPTGFGQPPQPTGFGQPAQPTGFGQPPQPAGFGQQPQNAGFGQPVQPTGFGQPPIPNNTTGFGQPPAVPSPFDQQQQLQQNNAFGQSTVMQDQPQGVFGRQADQPPPNASSSSQQAPNQAPAAGQGQGPSGNIAASATTMNGQASLQQNGPTATSTLAPPADGDLNSYTTRGADNTLQTWKGRPVSIVNGEPCYQRTDGGWERIWFPSGAPEPTQANAVDISAYPAAVTDAYVYLKQQGNFKDGIVPEAPPAPDMVRWDI